MDRAIQDLGDLNYTKHSAYLISSEISTMKSGLSESEYALDDTLCCSAFYATNNLFDDTNGCIRARYYNDTLLSGNQIVVFTDAYASADDFRTAMTGQKICYKLATPTTIQLTPHQIKLLEGVNYISTTGDKITLTYNNGEVATVQDIYNLYNDCKFYKYSADEHVVGQWIDGSLIYQKIVSVTSYTVGGTKLIPHGITNLGKLIRVWGRATVANGTEQPIPLPVSTGWDIRLCDFTATTFSFKAGDQLGGTYALGDIYIIIEYTKKTT